MVSWDKDQTGINRRFSSLEIGVVDENQHVLSNTLIYEAVDLLPLLMSRWKDNRDINKSIYFDMRGTCDTHPQV
jgi:hypothetical protein